jgi:hypothetical protein
VRQLANLFDAPESIASCLTLIQGSRNEEIRSGCFCFLDGQGGPEQKAESFPPDSDNRVLYLGMEQENLPVSPLNICATGGSGSFLI